MFLVPVYEDDIVILNIVYETLNGSVVFPTWKMSVGEHNTNMT